MGKHPVYLWVLPMFHCNGWCFPWTIAASGGTSVALRHVRAEPIYNAIRHDKVTHFCGAPIVLNMMNNAPDDLKQGVEHQVKDRKSTRLNSSHVRISYAVFCLKKKKKKKIKIKK